MRDPEVGAANIDKIALLVGRWQAHTMLHGGNGLTVGFIMIPRCEMRESEM